MGKNPCCRWRDLWLRSLLPHFLQEQSANVDLVEHKTENKSQAYANKYTKITSYESMVSKRSGQILSRELQGHSKVHNENLLGTKNPPALDYDRGHSAARHLFYPLSCFLCFLISHPGFSYFLILQHGLLASLYSYIFDAVLCISLALLLYFLLICLACSHNYWSIG